MRTSRKGQSSQRQHGFTVMELLVVVGILALIAGVAGWSRWGESPHIRVSAGQRTMLAMIRNVQQQAQAEGVPMALLIHVDVSDADRYCRLLVPAKMTTEGWQAVGQSILLPRGIWVVPSEEGNTPGEGWVTELRSSFSNGNQRVLVDIDGRGSSWFQVFAVGPDGRPDVMVREDYLMADMPGGGSADQRLCLSPGRRSGDETSPVQWNMPGATAGVAITRNGMLQIR